MRTQQGSSMHHKVNLRAASPSSALLNSPLPDSSYSYTAYISGGSSVPCNHGNRYWQGIIPWLQLCNVQLSRPLYITLCCPSTTLLKCYFLSSTPSQKCGFMREVGLCGCHVLCGVCEGPLTARPVHQVATLVQDYPKYAAIIAR